MNETDAELGLGDYLSLFRRRWRWVVGTVLVVGVAVAAFTLTRDEVYESRSQVQILTENNTAVFNNTIEELQRRALAELEYVDGARFQDAIDAAAGFDAEVTAIARTVEDGGETEAAGLILFRVEAPTADKAEAAAEAAAQIYLEDRHAQDVRDFTRLRDNDVEARTELRRQQAQLNAEIIDAVAAAELETDPLLKVQLEIDRDNIVAEREPQVENLRNQISNLSTDIRRYDQILTTLEDPESVATLSLPANRPKAAVSPDVPRNILLGLIVGLVLGAILAILRDLLDPRARDGAELAQLVDIPVMATINEIRGQRSAPGRVRRYADLSAEESSGYQVLLNSLWLSNVDNPLQSLVVTSDRPGVGKTQTVVNLAQAEAARGTRVLVVDTDFVNPSVASRLDLDAAGPGLVEVLNGSAALSSAITPSGIPNLDIIAAPEGIDRAGELLRSDRLAVVLAELYSSYDLIIIDSPPTLSTADSRLVASQADAVVVVYDPAQSRREELLRTIDLLRSARANLVGLVANRTRASHPVYLSMRNR